ncbi:MAG: acyl-CoA dehydrogenase family protein [Gammaproteobacteria bacterium]|nr:acyl-CoA dehydrogenase family protein [Gammaproteobacteria bacterium]
MDFSLSAEQQSLRELCQRFARERIAPGYLSRDASACIEPGLVEAMGELGLIGAELPESHGGLGLDGVTAGLIIEDIAYADMNVAYVQLLGSLLGAILVEHANPDIAREIVPRICAGKCIVALGLTEPGGGSDAANLRLRAASTDSGFVLNGEKTSISMVDQARHILVFARTGEQQARSRGISAFIVPMDAPGVRVSRFDDVGSRCVGRGSVFFDDVAVTPEQLVGTRDGAFRTVMVGFDYSRALIGLQCLAPAIASLDETWTYASERQAFGAPIVRNQGVSEPLAEAQTQIEAALLLCYKTLWLRDQGQPHTAEAAMCKWWPPKIAFEAIHQCLLTHGHMGYSKDLPFQQRMRDVLGLHIGDGTRQIQKMVITRAMVGSAAR